MWIEASWGADPLEFFGGFRALEYDPKATFSSSLARNGRVQWSTRFSESVPTGSDIAETVLAITFAEIDWAFLQSIYGWAASQHQAWARGYIDNGKESDQSILLYTDDLLEFWVDEVHYFGGDFYSFRKAPLVLHLSPGRHRLDLRMIHDVRAMGGFGTPEVSIRLRVEGTKSGLAIDPRSLLLPDVVNGKLAGAVASVPARNESTDLIKILDIASSAVCNPLLQYLSLH